MTLRTADDVQRALIDAIWRESDVAAVRTIAEDGGTEADKGFVVTLKGGAELRVTIDTNYADIVLSKVVLPTRPA